MKNLVDTAVESRLITFGLIVAIVVLVVTKYGFLRNEDYAAAVPLPEDILRLSWQNVEDIDIGFADAAARLGDVLYVLDQRQARVAMIGLDESGLRYLGTFGRPGGGPGEFQRALDVATDGISVFVLEKGGRLSRFDHGGRFVGSGSIRLPCPTGAMELAFVGADTLLAGKCADPGVSGDTIFGRLYRVSSDSPAVPVITFPLHTIRGDWGTMFLAEQFLATGPELAAFGTGMEECMWMGSGFENGDQTICGIGDIRMDVPQSETDRQALRELQEISPLQRAVYEWPRPFVAYTSKFVSGGEVGLVRLATTDTIFLSWLSEPAVPLLVAPTRNFVGCDNGVCLWFEADSNGARVATYCPDRKSVSRDWVCRPESSRPDPPT